MQEFRKRLGRAAVSGLVLAGAVSLCHCQEPEPDPCMDAPEGRYELSWSLISGECDPQLIPDTYFFPAPDTSECFELKANRCDVALLDFDCLGAYPACAQRTSADGDTWFCGELERQSPRIDETTHSYEGQLHVVSYRPLTRVRTCDAMIQVKLKQRADAAAP